MTDPDETANVIGEITEAWREHLANEAAKRPLTYHEASTGNIAGQIDRYGELDRHDALARAIAIGKARGTYEPNKYVNDEKFPPLTLVEHLEMLALGERIARYYRHPAQVDQAVKARSFRPSRARRCAPRATARSRGKPPRPNACWSPGDDSSRKACSGYEWRSHGLQCCRQQLA